MPIIISGVYYVKLRNLKFPEGRGEVQISP